MPFQKEWLRTKESFAAGLKLGLSDFITPSVHSELGIVDERKPGRAMPQNCRRIAGVHVNKKHIPGPQGVRGRNSDNTRLKEILRREPQISLEEGLKRTYLWIAQQVKELAAEYSFGIASFPPTGS